MPTDEISKNSRASGITTTQATEQPRIVWDDSNIRNVYSNVADVTGTLEEIMLLFGENQTGHTDQKELRVQLKERVVLGPLAAKRLALLLNKCIQEYESKHGPLKVESLPSTGPEKITLPRKKLPAFKTERTDERAGLVIKLVDNLDVKYGFERSFKMFEKILLANRFLLGFKKKRIRHEPHERILDICERMDMPENLVGAYSESLPDANYLHFGFGENEGTCLYKAYLEFYEKVEKEIKNQPGKSGPFLMHLGFKWDVLDNSKRALTRYTWHPLLSVEDILVRLSNILDPQKFRNLIEIAKGIVGFASRIVHPNDILYLDVTEENNPRRSFDINMYRANIQLGELYPFLSKMCRHFAIPPEEFHALYDGIKAKRFGHISGGIDREGRDFLTVYYGVEYTAVRNPGEPSLENGPKEQSVP